MTAPTTRCWPPSAWKMPPTISRRSMLRMLAACEYSGRVRDAFAARGWDAWSCDVLPSETTGQHIQGDIRSLFTMIHPHAFDLIIAFPPCTDLSLAGARFWAEKRADGRQQAAANF